MLKKQFPILQPAARQADTKDAGLGIRILLASMLVMAVGGLLVWFAVLRESQAFWTNAGGYPIWLRNLVRLTYLPLFAVAVAVLAVLSMVCYTKVWRSARVFVMGALILLVCWGLLAISGYIAMSNNITNLLEGRELHYHPQ